MAAQADKNCDRCEEPYKGFGTTCSACRKAAGLGKQGSIRACEVCGAFNQSFAAICPECLAGERDTHVSVRLRFKLPEAENDNKNKNPTGWALQLEELKQSLAGALQASKDKLYSGFSIHDDDELLLRAGFEAPADAVSFFQHIKAPLDKAVALCGPGNFTVHISAPKDECRPLQEAAGIAAAEVFELEETCRWYNRGAPGQDRHVSLSPFFTVPEGKLEEFKALLPKFYEGSRRDASRERLYYGWAISGRVVFCRQGFKSAEGVLAHLRDADSVLEEALAMVGVENMDLACVGPVEELEKLRIVLGPHTPHFFELCEDAEWLTKR